MHNTPFAGLTELDPGDPITVDGAGFLQRNPSKTDAFLKIGAVTHRHDGHLPVPDPSNTVLGAITGTVGGNVGAGLDLYFAYTLVDAQGGETRRGPAAQVTTPYGLLAPSGALGAVFSSAAGGLPVGQFAYAVTLNDGGGGESTIGPAVFIQRPAGYASGEIVLSGLARELAPLGSLTGWVSYNLWRTQDGGSFEVVAVNETSDTFIDDGLICTDASRVPPNTMRTVQAHNTVLFYLPPDTTYEPALASATAINVYISQDGTFADACFYQSYPVASAGHGITITDLTLTNRTPPAVSTATRGANQINPDTDLLDWHWKRPVPTPDYLPMTGNASADVRAVLAPPAAVMWNGSEWVTLPTRLTVEDIVGNQASGAIVQMVGASGVTISITQTAVDQIRVTIGASGGIGPAGASGASGPAGASGAPGPAGASGAPGPAGASGAPGPVGASGAPGPAGASGAPGAPGPQGPAGSSAVFVASGGTGSAIVGPGIGFVGSGATQVQVSQSGSSAIVTITTPAVAGPAGASGAPGPAGASGAPGPQGPQGPQGLQGAPGTGGGGGAIAVGGSAAQPLLTPVDYIEFVASGGGGSLGVTNLGGGSAQVTITMSAGVGPQGPAGASGAAGPAGASGAPGPAGSAANFIAADTYGGSALVGPELLFVGSGAASASVAASGGSAVVTITVPQPLQGPAGPQGPAGAQGPAGSGGTGGTSSLTVAASGGASAIAPAAYVEFIGSAGVAVDVSDLGGGSARVVIRRRKGLAAYLDAAAHLPGLVHFWGMDETSGTTAADRAGSSPLTWGADVSGFLTTGPDGASRAPVNNGSNNRVATAAGVLVPDVSTWFWWQRYDQTGTDDAMMLELADSPTFSKLIQLDYNYSGGVAPTAGKVLVGGAYSGNASAAANAYYAKDDQGRDNGPTGAGRLGWWSFYCMLMDTSAGAGSSSAPILVYRNGIVVSLTPSNSVPLAGTISGANNLGVLGRNNNGTRGLPIHAAMQGLGIMGGLMSVAQMQALMVAMGS